MYKHYYQAIIVLLNTGLRISELCGLTLADIDFNTSTINHQLKRDKNGYYTEQPKSDSSYRKVPMSDIVYETLKYVLKNRKNAQPIIVDGYCDFIFLNKQGYPMYNTYYISTFKIFVKNITNAIKKINYLT
ncbi:tyrosine-type recombinase/integrase [Clostridioides difficile]